MLNKREQWAEERAPGGIQGKAIRFTKHLIQHRQDFGRDVERFVCCMPNVLERGSQLVSRELSMANS